MTAPTEAVSNNRQNMIQASYILRPYFDLHNQVKANVLQGLIEQAKVAYAGGKQRKLTYILDDLSLQLLEIDGELLDASTYGLFVANATSAYEAKQMVMQLAQAAMQNQRADITDIIKVIRSESVQESEELLEAAQMRKDEQMQNQQSQAIEAQSQQAELERQNLERLEDKKHQNKMDEIRLKGELDLQKQAMLSVGFNEDKDIDNDGQLDVLELYKLGQKARIDSRKQALAEAQFDHQKKVDQTKENQTDQKLKIDRAKATKSNASH
jgi:hypothetical protein